MARRLDIELTSTREDGTWTWRAAGAKVPKGVLDGALIPEGIGIGDVIRVEAEADMEGLEVTMVLPPRAGRKTPETLELLGSGRDEPLVTQTLAPRGKGRERGRGRDGGRERGRDGRREGGRDGGRERGRDGRREGGPGRGRDGGRGKRKGRDRRDERGDTKERAKAPARPKAPRLRPGRVHRQVALKALPDIQRGVAEEVLKGGVPGVRQAVDRMNEKATAEGMPKVKSEPLVALAEVLAPKLKAAEWRDRAEAALAGISVIDVKDIRSVVVAADTGARDDESRALADELREGLGARVDAEHRKWLDELAENLAEGRTVRALRHSSRPPKAGAPLPPDMAQRLAAAASASLTSEVTQDRWATVLDAIAFSPVRAQVVPEGLPASPGDQLLAAVRKHAGKVPAIAASFGVAAPTPRKRGGRRPPPPPAAKGAVPPPVVEAAVLPPVVEAAVLPPVVEAAVPPPVVEAAVPPPAAPDPVSTESAGDSPGVEELTAEVVETPEPVTDEPPA